MLLQRNKVLKLVAILLFSFELLAPAILVTTQQTPTLRSESTNFTSLSHSFDLFSGLIFEEANEEREGKDHNLTGICFIEIFSILHKFKSTDTAWVIPHHRFDTRPSLLTLHRVLLI